ncbi:hypothetical protein Q3G72_032244 [Acer saccharum]|nr:hypothetical protein Q3G72_032244 [Acer saccharum]
MKAASKLFKQKGMMIYPVKVRLASCKALLQHFSNLLQHFCNMLQNDEKNADDFNEFFKGESHSLLKLLVDHLDLSSELDEVSASEAQQGDLKCPHLVKECLPEAQSGLVSEKEDVLDVFFKRRQYASRRRITGDR